MKTKIQVELNTDYGTIELDFLADKKKLAREFARIESSGCPLTLLKSSCLITVNKEDADIILDQSRFNDVDSINYVDLTEYKAEIHDEHLIINTMAGSKAGNNGIITGIAIMTISVKDAVKAIECCYLNDLLPAQLKNDDHAIQKLSFEIRQFQSRSIK